MKLIFTPFPTFVSYKSLDKNVGGLAKLCFVSIREDKKEDKGIHAHEYRHVTHFYLVFLLMLTGLYFIPSESVIIGLYFVLSLFTYNLLTTFIPRFRLFVEIDCYRKQIKTNGDQQYINLYAEFIATRYDIPNVNKEWVIKKLSKK